MRQKRNKADLPPPPENWQSDALSRFFAIGDYNLQFVFARYTNMWPHFANIDDAYDTLVGNLDKTPYEASVFLLMRSHSAYLAALRLALSTQFVDAFPLLRSTLEYTVYALYFRDHEDKYAVWSKRHQGDEERKAVRNLSFRKMLDYLESKDSKLGGMVKTLYESTIDLGAHPNPAAVASAYELHMLDNIGYHEIRYYGGEGLSWRVTLQWAALVGFSAIKTASYVFPEQASSLGISEKLDAIQAQMAPMFDLSDL